MRFSSLVSRGERPTVLNSWKEIANYLARAVRTAQRWERNSKLPVHRIGNGPKAPVFAFGEELDTWLEQQSMRDPVLCTERNNAHSPSRFREGQLTGCSR
jgi:hypothetical protein